MTGVVACLVSPITWVHHLVWLAPGLILLVQKESTRRLAIMCYVLLVSCLVWLWSLDHSGPLGFVGSNAYVFVSLAVLAALASPLPVPAFVGSWIESRVAPRLAPSLAPSLVTGRLLHPASHRAVSSPNNPASQWMPTIQVLASAHARHLR